MARLFPKQPYEDDTTYSLRRDRAVYLPYAGNIVNMLCSSLAAEPVSVTGSTDLDPFYADFVESVDGRALTLQGLLKCMFSTALQCGTSWALVDLPPMDSGAVIESAKDEESIGALDAVCFPIEPEAVLDFEEDPSGDLNWAVVCLRSQPRGSINDARDTIIERFTVFTRETWTRYEVKYKAASPPKPTDEVAIVAEGEHSFGRVPLIRLQLPDGLWAMDLIANVAKAHFNLRSSVAWSQSKALYPQLTAFLAPEMGKGGEIPADVAQNPTRATDQILGVGRVLQFGAGDRLEYVGPNPAIYTAAYADLESLRDEIYRVLNSMAQAANTNKAIQRSGKSKEMDRASATVVLMALGVLGREFVKEVYETVCEGRKDPPQDFAVHGLQIFDTSSISDVIEDSAVIDTLKIPSETFQRIRIGSIAKRIVTGIATPEQLEAIDAELEKNISAEEFAGNAAPTSAVEWATGEPQAAPSADPGDESGPAEAPTPPTGGAKAPPKV